MCSAREKLRQVGRELDATYEELRDTRIRLARAIHEKETAELEAQITKQRNMCLTRNADVSNFGMCAALMIAFVLVGLLVYIL